APASLCGGRESCTLRLAPPARRARWRPRHSHLRLPDAAGRLLPPPVELLLIRRIIRCARYVCARAARLPDRRKPAAVSRSRRSVAELGEALPDDLQRGRPVARDRRAARRIAARQSGARDQRSTRALLLPPPH